MKTIAVYFTSPGDDSYPLDETYYKIAYRELAEKVAAKGARLVVVRSMETYLGNGKFSKYWAINPTEFTLVREEIEPDLIYNKGHFTFTDGDVLPILNHRELDRICLLKSATYEVFPELCPLTTIVRSREEAEAALRKISTDMAVIKPIDGEEGKGVFIGPKDTLLEKIPAYPYLAQEFIDTSSGIPGITDGMHDLRVTLINGEISNCFVRIPAKGKLVSNLAQGGRKQEVPFDTIPKEALDLTRAVEKKFSEFGDRVYSIDMGRDASGTWKIIELNSQPGVTCRSEGPISILFQDRLADLLSS